MREEGADGVAGGGRRRGCGRKLTVAAGLRDVHVLGDLVLHRHDPRDGLAEVLGVLGVLERVAAH